MLSKKQIQSVRVLHQKKFRDQSATFIVEGPKLLDDLLKSEFEIKQIFATAAYLDQHPEIKKGISEIIKVSPAELSRISLLKTPNQVLAVAASPHYDIQDFAMPEDFVLVLDGISDPGNLGTILRTADWFGMSRIICSTDCVELFNPKVVQAAMGSVFRVKVFYTDLDVFFDKFQNIPVYGTFLKGNNIYREVFPSQGFLVVGSESHGISAALAPKITKPLHIPADRSQAESLNASVAAALCCSEIKRNFLRNG